MRTTTLAAALSLATLVAAPPAFASETVVQPSHSAIVVVPVTVQQLAPPACDGLALTSLVIAAADGSGNGNGGGNGGGNGNGGGGGGGGGPSGVTTVRGTAGNDLMLGSPERDRLDGRGGSDCLVGGAGDDHLDGGQGQDACLPGGDAGDTTANCETVA